MPDEVQTTAPPPSAAYYSPRTREHVIIDEKTPIAAEMRWLTDHEDAINLILGAALNNCLPVPTPLR